MSESESSGATSTNPIDATPSTSIPDKGLQCEKEDVLSKQEESLPKLSASDFQKYNRMANIMSQYVSLWRILYSVQFKAADFWCSVSAQPFPSDVDPTHH